MTDQPSLFTHLPPTPTVASGIGAVHTDPTAGDATLTGDRYAWLTDFLADLLPAPKPPECERCGNPTRLPATAPVLFTCPACHPKEAR